MNSKQLTKNCLRAATYLAVIATVLLVTYFVYRPGLSGPFLLDDFSSLSALGADGGVNSLPALMQFVFGNTSGPTGRPVSMLSFLIDGQDWPVASTQFKYTNIMIHLLTGLLLGWFALLLFSVVGFSGLKLQISALVVASLWLLHPLNVSTTLYVVQRMTQLMTLFSLAALICYMKGRVLVNANATKGLMLLCLSLFPFGLFAVLSKENGALLLLAILVLEFTFFANLASSKVHKIWLISAVCLPLFMIFAYMAITFEALTEDYTFRNFSLMERLLTETRIICDYLVGIFIPQVNEFGLFRDDVLISSSLVNPLTTLVALSFLSGLVLMGFMVRTRNPVLSFAIFWFLGWHLIESTFLPLELYFEHRNYLAMMGPLIGLVYYLAQALSVLEKKFAIRILQSTIGFGLILCIGMTLQLTQLWGNTGALLTHWAMQKPGSVRAQIVYADTLAAVGNPDIGFERLLLTQQLHPQEITLLLHSWNYACNHGTVAPYSLKQISQMEQLEFFRDDINFQLRVLIENLDNESCAFPPQQHVVAFMERIAELPMRAWDSANFHFLFSDVFVYYRQLTPALIELSEAFEYRQTADIPIRQAILSASAGNFADSLVFLERAREADSKRGPMLPSRVAEILRMEQDLQARLGVD